MNWTKGMKREGMIKSVHTCKCGHPMYLFYDGHTYFKCLMCDFTIGAGYSHREIEEQLLTEE